MRIAAAVTVAIIVLATGCDPASQQGGSVATPTEDRPTERPDPPNVLIIVTDDQPASMLRVMRKTRLRIGRAGTTFSNAVVTTPLCCPSRASIFTGRYAHNHGVTTNGRATVRNFPGDSSLATVLNDNGYLTGISGKFLNSWPRVFDRPPGFDRWAVYGKGIRPPYSGATFNVDGRTQRVDEYGTSFTGRKAIQYLDEFHGEDRSAPWFLVVAPHAPHDPATPERRYRGARVPALHPRPTVGEDLSDKPGWVRNASVREQSHFIELHSNMQRSLLSVDDMVDEIMSRLERHGDAGNTLIFFTSDNGFVFGEHGLGGKRYPYDSSVRVPLLMRWTAGRVPAGTTDERIVTNVDIAATIFDAADIDPGFPLDGRSLLDDFERDEALIEFNDPTWRKTPAYTMLWHPKWALIRYTDSGELEYYGRDDPHQATNLYGDGVAGNEPDNEKAMVRRLQTYEACKGADCP